MPKTKALIKTTGFDQLIKTTPPNKEEREGFAEDLVSKISEGKLDPIKVHFQLKNLEDVLKLIKENEEYKKLILDEVEKNQGEEKFYSYEGAKFSTSETGVKYDYRKCDDPIIQQLHKEQKELDEKVKKREKFLQSISKNGEDILFEDGEVRKLYPPVKTSSTSVIVKLS